MMVFSNTKKIGTLVGYNLDENRRDGSLCGVLVLGAVGQQALFMQRSPDTRRGLIDRTLYMEEAAFAQHAQDRASPRRVQRVQLGMQLRDPSVHMASQVDESRPFDRKARDEEKMRWRADCDVNLLIT